ncbi:MAG: SAM-dependent methyltransferase [Planctomycetaceae bacterium]
MASSPSSAAAPTPDPDPPGSFLLATCQPGAEEVLAVRLAAALPGSARGAWRRGVVSVRLPAAGELLDLDLLRGRVVFARALFRCFGQAHWKGEGERSAALRDRLPEARFDALHCVPRDVRGVAAADVASSPAAVAAAAALGAEFPHARLGPARPGEIVLDCVVDGPDRWWLGWHRATTPATLHPGGYHPRALPSQAVSRAWLKLDEAIATFGIDIAPGTRVCEWGAAPGGACQRLLEAGLEVVAVDPAPLDAVVALAPGFTQWRKRARDVALRDMRGFRWLLSDMNIDPTSTLEAVGRVATAPGSTLEGLVLTLKIPDWSRAAALDEWLAAVRSWGFAPEARQLSTGGREVCVVARRGTRPRAARRRGGRQRSIRGGPRGATRRADR